MVCSRCAMVNTVHLSNSFLMVCWMMASVLKWVWYRQRQEWMHRTKFYWLMTCPERMTTANCTARISWGQKHTNVHLLLYVQGKFPNASTVYILDDITYAMSTLAVASSMTSTLSLRRIARARQYNCLCPTLKFPPPSVTSLSSLAGDCCTASFISTCDKWRE